MRDCLVEEGNQRKGTRALWEGWDEEWRGWRQEGGERE